VNGAYEAAQRISGDEELFAKACLYGWIAGNMSFHEAEPEEEVFQKSLSILKELASPHLTDASVGERLEMDRRHLFSIWFAGR
jgi:hypothetical protein